MKRTSAAVAVGAILLSGGCAMPPEGVSAEDVAEYKAAVASIGCEMVSESDYLPVELQAGLTRQQAKDITAYLLASGEAERLENGGAKLTTGACA